MPKAKKNKRSIEFYLNNFANWLNKAEYDPAITSSVGKKLVKVNLKYDPKENMAGFTKELSKILKTFLIKLTSNPSHHQKLAKEYKQKLGNLHSHLDEALEKSDVSIRGKAQTLKALRKEIENSSNKVVHFLHKSVASKHTVKASKAKGYIDAYRHQPPAHLKGEKRYKNKQGSTNKTYRGGTSRG